MQQDTAIYLTKAIESLLTAETEFINGRYNSCANRCYYASFQAAIVATDFSVVSFRPGFMRVSDGYPMKLYINQ